MEPLFSIYSPQTKTEYKIWIASPDPDLDPGPWPVAVLMDGDILFPKAVEGYRRARKQGKAAPLLLVGVGYGVPIGKPGNLRNRDYTQTHVATEEGTGGAAPFLDFLTNTLWPEVVRRYPVRTDLAGLGGHSLGSLFLLYALFQEKRFFSHYL